MNWHQNLFFLLKITRPKNSCPSMRIRFGLNPFIQLFFNIRPILYRLLLEDQNQVNHVFSLGLFALATILLLHYRWVTLPLAMSYFDVEEEEKKFKEKHPSCDGLRKEFIDCITQSDCFQKVIQ